MELPGLRTTPADPALLLDEVRRMSIERLGALPGVLFAPIETQLTAAVKADTESGGLGGVQREELMLLKVLRQRSAAHVMRYREQIARGFDALTGRAGPAPRDGHLSLVSEDELAFRLLSERMAEAVAGAFQSNLDALARRFTALAAALGRAFEGNPVAPERLAEALVVAFRDADLSMHLQQLLVEQYQRELTHALGELYPRIEAALQGLHHQAQHHQAQPAFIETVPMRAASAQAQPQDAAEAADPVAGMQPLMQRSMKRAATGGREEFFRVPEEAQARHQQLRDMLHVWRGAPRAAAAPAGQARPRRDPLGPKPFQAVDPGARGPASAQDENDYRQLRPDELVSVVALLQADIYEPFERALAGRQPLHEAIREHMLDGAHRLGIDMDKALVSQGDADAIDLVGLLFEALSASGGPWSGASSSEARRLLARLVMTYVRIALTDEALFVRAGHPAKRLIDAIGLSLEDNQGATAQDRELLASVESVVERIVTEFNEDLAIFDLSANELQHQLEQQRKRASVAERRSAEAAQGRERLLQARMQAASALAQRVGGQPLTGTISRFLARYWRHHYEQALLRAGREPERAGKATALADALVALDAAATRRNGADIADRLLALQGQLEQCCADSGLDPASAGEWFAGIARALAFPDAPREAHALPATPQLTEEDGDEQVRALLGGEDAAPDPRLIARAERLQVDDWLRLVDADGREGAVRVAWISAVTARRLLVNRRGLRKLAATPQQLAALAGVGRLSFDAEPLPFDHALRQVRERLADPAEPD